MSAFARISNNNNTRFVIVLMTFLYSYISNIVSAGVMSLCVLQEVCLYVCCRRHVFMCTAGGMSLCVLQEVCVYVHCRRYVSMCTAGGMSLCAL